MAAAYPQRPPGAPAAAASHHFLPHQQRQQPQQLGAAPAEQPLGVPVKALLGKRVRVFCPGVAGSLPAWKAGVATGYNHG